MAQLFSRILLATEHSEYDAGAERMAFAMAKRCQLPLAAVLPLVSNPEYEALAPQIAAKAEKEAAAKIANLQAQATDAGVTIELQVRRGEEAYEEIVDEAKVRQTDMVVIRRRGKRGILANLLVGEMVSKVVAHAPCHVLIVPRESHMWTQRILVAAEPTDLGLKIVATASDVASQCGLPLHVVCVVAAEGLKPAAQSFIARSVELAKSKGIVATGEVRLGRPFSEILEARAQTVSDLIVLGARSDGRLGRALVGGVAQKVMGLSEHPVMVLHS
jgi:nucleotide-binding universal stress UspA family protein